MGDKKPLEKTKLMRELPSGRYHPRGIGFQAFQGLFRLQGSSGTYLQDHHGIKNTET